MQGSRAKFKPEPAVEVSYSDEASKLTTYLQKQLEDDIARVFDESIYPDIELECGKLKILSHVCILKTRSNNFYRKLETILHVNIDRRTFDEIYSFVSDSYTECDIKRQEKEILSFLKSNGYGDWPISKSSEEAESYSTPKCLTPLSERNTQKSVCSSPSIELTKEYYALVPIEGNILEKELIEQEELSNAFHSIIKSQNDILKSKVTRVIKPTSLSLSSSHTTTITDSNNCDISSDDLNGFKTSSENSKSVVGNNTVEKLYFISDIPDLIKKTNCDRHFDSTYSPDSLITDETSSASDYLSATYASPGFANSGLVISSNVANSSSKMENNFHSSDSGLEQTGLQESLNSNRNGTLIDVSLTESQSTFTETHCSSLTQSSENFEPRNSRANNADSTNEPAETESQSKRKSLKYKSSKEEKQRQNEEIVILESSSLSSETGSWESVFPPRPANKATTVPDDEINTEELSGNPLQNISQTVVTKSPFKSTSCFIDAASLADEEESERIQIETNGVAIPLDHATQNVQPTPTQPLPCSTVKLDLSPTDKSESNDNDDSLEQGDKDLSPTIFQMTPTAEDSVSSNIIESAFKKEISKDAEPIRNGASTAYYTVTTPYNSIMSLKSPSLKQYESEIESDTSKESQPIVSGGASVEDHLPNIGMYTCSPSARRKLESAPIISGGFSPEVGKKSKSTKSPRSSAVSAWVVDMSIEVDKNCSNVKRPGDKVCETLKKETLSSCSENCCKSRSSVDSDSSERSSQKFYIDLSSLSDQSLPGKNSEAENNAEKKNIFSMFIDLGETSKVKEMPARLSSSLNTKKLINAENKSPKIDTPKPSVKKNSKDNAKEQNQLETTFEAIENLCNDPNISISEIVKLKPAEDISSENNLETQTNPKNLRTSPKEKENNFNNKKEVLTEESFDEQSEDVLVKLSDIDKSLSLKFDASSSRIKSNIEVLTEESFDEKSGDIFVKLSDLDKPLTLKFEASPSMIKSNIEVPMIRSTPNSDWQETAQKNTSRSVDIISSFHSENTLTLNRLFPNLKNELSVSVPSTLSGRTRSPSRLVANIVANADERASDVSEISSVQSSICRSGIENSTTEDTSQTSSLISNCQSRLGQDLLRMFLEEIAPDVIVEVSGRRIKAHKCILSSRCQYFAGILSGGWVESSGNVIVLPPFSFNVVHFALCHIYSGVSTIPDSISIVELATIADMLGLEGLKEVIMFTLKAKYCHYFHKPCQVCTAGVLECFPLSSVYGLDDLYLKCLRWITKHFFKVWPTKAFATLPKELLDKCYQELVVNMNVENLVDTVYGCGVTVASLQNSRWAESVGRMCRRLLNAAAHFAAARLVSVLGSLGGVEQAGASARQAMDDCVAAAIEWAPPDEACRAYAFLSEVAARPDLLASGESLLLSRASAWRVQCEGALVRAAPRVVASQAFKELPPDLRKRLRELGCIMYGTHVLPPACSPLQDRKTRSAYQPAPPKNTTSTRSLDIDHVRTSFVPYAPKPVKVGSIDILKNVNDNKQGKKFTKSQPPKIRMTKAQEERAKFNLTKTNLSQERNIKMAQKPKLENARSRYLEPRPVRKTDKAAGQSTNKLMHKMISSSESSRNSSPIQARSNRMKNKQGDKLKPQAMSQDSLATSSRPWTAEPSTDSLSESQKSNKYATYTKAKHLSKESVESVKTKTQSTSSTSTYNTKIPVYFKHIPKANIGRSRFEANKLNSGPSKNLVQNGSSVVAPARVKQADHKVPASLMCATKSSSAKIVTKVVKEAQKTKNATSKQKTTNKLQEATASPEIPIMERSGTFLKDELTFGDKTIHINQ